MWVIAALSRRGLREVRSRRRMYERQSVAVEGEVLLCDEGMKCVTMGMREGGVSQWDEERGCVTMEQACIQGRGKVCHRLNMDRHNAAPLTIGISAELAQFRRKRTKESPVVIRTTLVHKSMNQHHLLLLRGGRPRLEGGGAHSLTDRRANRTLHNLLGLCHRERRNNLHTKGSECIYPLP